jgi:hypothetical protein
MRGTSLIKRVIISLLVCEAIMALSVSLLVLRHGRTLVAPETIRFAKFASGVGISVTLVVFGICHSLAAKYRYAAAISIGAVVGLVMSVLSGYVWALLADVWASGWGLDWTPLNSWVGGLLLAVPSAFSGAAIGWLQVRFSSRSTLQ